MRPAAWHGMIAVALIAAFFSFSALVTYLLYGPGITVTIPDMLLNMGRATSTAQSSDIETNISSPDVLAGLPGVLFECVGDKALKVNFSEGIAHMALSDGRRISLPQTASASGARYANTDESFVFHTKDYGAFVEENGIMTYTDCVLRP